MKATIEYTDTFGREANYSWCHRETIEIDEKANDAKVKKEAKKAMNLSGVRGNGINH